MDLFNTNRVKALEAEVAGLTAAHAEVVDANLKRMAELRRSHAADLEALRQQYSSTSSEISELRKQKAKVEAELAGATEALATAAADFTNLQKKADAVEADMNEQIRRYVAAKDAYDKDIRKMTREHHKSMADATAAFAAAFAAQEASAKFELSSATTAVAEKELLLKDAAATIESLCSEKQQHVRRISELLRDNAALVQANCDQAELLGDQYPRKKRRRASNVPQLLNAAVVN